MENVNLSFEGNEAILQSSVIDTGNKDGLKLPLKLYARKAAADPAHIYYETELDGVSWFTTESQMHAIVLYNMLKGHVMEYMHYKAL